MLLEGPLASPGASGWALALILALVTAAVIGLSRVPADRRAPALFALGFRLAAVFLAWSFLALEPAWVQVRSESQQSRILLALDLSSSMETTDPQRGRDEKLRLAQALGLAEEHGDPVDRLTRADIARRLLAEAPVNLLSRLAEAHQVELVGFDQELVESPSLIQSAVPSAPGVRDTDMGLPLRHLLQSRTAEAGKPLGVILLSDGQHQRGTNPTEAARELGRRGLPIYAVAIGARQPPTDVSVVELKAPPQAFKNADTAVEARVRLRNLPAQQVTVELTDRGPPATPLARQTIKHTGRDGTHKVRLDFKPAELGLRRLELRVQAQSPGDGAPVERRLPALVRVMEDKVRVLLVDDEARWEHQYLAAALGRDTDVRVDRILFDAPALGLARDDKEREAARLPATRWPEPIPEQEDPLWRYDCIVLGDVAPRHLPRPIEERLERYVAQREGTLIVSAGKRHMPQAYLAVPDDHPLTKLLPVESVRRVAATDGFRLRPTEAASSFPFLQPAEKGVTPERHWADMPELYWGLVGKPRPGATALATAEPVGGKQRIGDTEALLAMQPVGLGKAVWIGIDATWRWRYRVGDRDHHRFWGELIRWAAAEGGTPDRPRIADFGSRSPAYSAGQPAELFLRPGPDAPKLDPRNVRLELLRQRDGRAEAAASIRLAPNDIRPGLWEAKATGLAPGEYRVRLDAPGLAGKVADDDPLRRRDHFTVLPAESGELADLSTNWDLLQSLADGSGGRLFAADEAGQLPSLLARQTTSRERRTEWRPWRDPPYVWWTLGVLLGLLTLEWVVRKSVGLP